jgi:hypothetical protein
MLRGCLFLILIYVVAVYLEYQSLKSLPFAGHVAAILALGVTLVLGSLQGLVQALRLRALPQTDIGQWRDGQQVRVAGVLHATGDALRAPISDRPALFCDYMGKARHVDYATTSREAPHWHGFLAAPCALRTSSTTLAVVGMPSLREVPQTLYQGSDRYPSAARHLARTDWQIAPELANVMSQAGGEKFSGGMAGLPQHLINHAALERLRMRIGESSEAELLEALGVDQWRFGERIAPPGAEVTLIGTYRANPPSIDINGSVSTPEHALHLGGAERTAARHLVATLIFIVVLAGITVAAHYAVYADDRLGYLSALRGLGLLD